MSIFAMLNSVNVNENTEKKNGLTYLSWAWAWAEVKKIVPNATYTIYERDTEFGPVNYFTDGKTCWVKTGVTLEGLEHIEELPVMDFKNKSVPLANITSMDVNKAIQRSLTKACARHGLGLYIYAGEDLPECEQGDAPKDDTPRQGSKEAAQEAGKRKLEQINAQLAEEAQKAAGAPTEGAKYGSKQPATEQQKELIRKTASDEDYLNIMQKYGPDLERLSANGAAKVINEINRRNAEAS